MQTETDKAKDNAAMSLRKRGFLARLKSDASGNALMITAACMIPLAAAIGGGVDMSRAYLAKARLNNACDAAALAARRSMTGLDITAGTNEDARKEGTKFFNFNFPAGTMNTTPINPDSNGLSKGPTYSRPTDGVVQVTATTNVPTSVMKIFGFTEVPISVACNATQNFDNIDIVLVLDTTGSMRCKPSDSPTTSCSTELSDSKLVALREAVASLYDILKETQDQLHNNKLRLRYGIVPYSSTVNVGYQLPSGSMVDNWTYQTRVPNFTPQTVFDHYDTSTSTSNSSTTNGPTQTTKNNKRSACIALNDTTVTGPTTTKSGNTNTTTTVTTTMVATHSTSSGDKNGTCTIKTTIKTDTSIETTTQTAVYKTINVFTSWTYKELNYDVSHFVSSPYTITTPTASQGTNRTITWAGCIEERHTSSNIVGSTTSIPTDALDMDINALPDSNNNNTRWKPYLSSAVTPARPSNGPYSYSTAVYSRSGSSPVTTTTDNDQPPQIACPAQAMPLAEIADKKTLTDYLITLHGDGGTYHDIGMIWGARWISPDGIFKDSNPKIVNDRPVNKFIIFMTDGLLDTGGLYSAYGLEALDKRVTGTGNMNDQDARHAQRFQLACAAARDMNVQIWAIQFMNVANVDPTLVQCADSPDRVSAVADKANLIKKFNEIGKNIGALRLSQ